MSLVVIETHPVQYHAPVYRALQRDFGIPMIVIYGSDFSVSGYRDREFGAVFAWDTDLLSGYTSHFLSRVAEGGARRDSEVQTKGLREVLRNSVPDAVMVLGYSPRFHRQAFLTASRAGYPILFRGETNDGGRKSVGPKTWIRDSALRLFYARCNRLLYIGQRSKEHFERLGCSDSKLIFSPYCVDTTPFQTDETAREQLRNATRAALSIETGKKVVLFSGKLSARKGPDLLLDSIKRLPPHIRDRIVLLFLGSGDLEADLQSVAKQSPVVDTRFLGFQNQTQLSRYYHAADMLVLPSLKSETWGLVVNDALHHGIPCVVSDIVGCAPDLIEPGVTGATFPRGSASGLADAMASLLPLTDLSETRSKCRDKVANYTIEKAAEGIARAYFGLFPNRQPLVNCT